MEDEDPGEEQDQPVEVPVDVERVAGLGEQRVPEDQVLGRVLGGDVQRRLDRQDVPAATHRAGGVVVGQRPGQLPEREQAEHDAGLPDGGDRDPAPSALSASAAAAPRTPAGGRGRRAARSASRASGGAPAHDATRRAVLPREPRVLPRRRRLRTATVVRCAAGRGSSPSRCCSPPRLLGATPTPAQVPPDGGRLPTRPQAASRASVRPAGPAGRAARRRPGAVPGPPAGRAVRPPRRPLARRARRAGCGRGHPAGRAGGPALPGPEHGAGGAVVRDHRHRRAALGRLRRRLLRGVQRGVAAAVGRGGGPRTGCSSCSTCSPAGPACWTRRSATRELLRLPHVGLAVDPEWKLGRHQRPLQPDRQHRRRRDQPDLGLAGRPGPRRATCRRSCSWCTSSGCR